MNAIKSISKEPDLKFIDVGRGLVFCTLPKDVSSPVKIATKIVKDVENSGELISTVINRIVPLEIICQAENNAINDTVTKQLSAYLEKVKDKEKLTFRIEFNRRYTDRVKRDEIIELVAKSIVELGKTKKIELEAEMKTPKVTIFVEVCKTICGIAIVEDYNSLYKMNIRTAAKAKHNHVAA